MFFKPKLVKFEDGYYGVRTFWFFGWHFKSTSLNYDFSRDDAIDACCKMDLIKAQNMIDKLRDRENLYKVKYEIIE